MGGPGHGDVSKMGAMRRGGDASRFRSRRVSGDALCAWLQRLPYTQSKETLTILHRTILIVHVT